MLPHRYTHSRHGARDGLALIMVLAFIFLLTVLIVSFVSFTRLNHLSTASYSKSIQAQEIAQGGLQDILGDLRTEMIAGSTTNTVGTNTIYVPTTNWTALPARAGYSANLYTNDVSSAYLPPTLIRVSRASQNGTLTAFYPNFTTNSYFNSTISNLLNRASASNTASNSVNGSYLSATRWNKIDLLSTNGTIPPPFATNTPDWVYVTRTGSRVCQASEMASLKPSNNLAQTYTITPGSNPPPSPVCGRYAYAIYDEGALLDVNVAGYISNAGNNTYGYATNVIASPASPATNNPAGIAQNLSSKSYLAYADLTQLPGLTNAQASVIDPLVRWRNGSVSLSTASTAATNYFQTVYTRAQNGFTTFSFGDSPLLGRQDLINYFANLDRGGGTSYSSALPYLGTFSRANNAPSWTPTLDSTNLPGYFGTNAVDDTSGTNYDFVNVAPVTYKSSAESTSSVNRDLPNVRYPNGTPAGTAITHYDDLGNATTYYVSAGDSVVRHRFSLAKLAWLTYKGPSADLVTSDPLYNAGGTDANIKACFGLVWDGQNLSGTGTTYHYDRWDYAAATTSGVHILTLNEVANGCASTGYTGYREPNFFEMLKAGILSGSLGQSPGAVGTEAGASSSFPAEGVAGENFDTVSADPNRHILQIGANIIAQSSLDSFPTTLYLALFGPQPPATAITTEADLAVNTVYGDKNLPYITRIAGMNVEDPIYTNSSGSINGCCKIWMQPELWNPHQAPGVGVTLANYPTQFRLHAYGEVQGANDLQGVTRANSTLGWVYAQAINYDDATNTDYYYSTNAAQTTTTGAAASLIYFHDSQGGTAGSTFYQNPTFLALTNPSVSFTTAGGTLTGTPPLNMFVAPNYANLPVDLYNHGTNQFVGFYSGEDPTVPDLTSYAYPNAGIHYWPLRTIPQPSIYFSIECMDPSGHWHPYNFISQVTLGGLEDQADVFPAVKAPGDSTTYTTYQNYSGVVGTGHAVNGTTIKKSPDAAWIRLDPRTDRFSVTQSRYSDVDMNNSMETGTGNNINPNTIHFPRRLDGFMYYPLLAPAAQNTYTAPYLQYEASWVQNTTNAPISYSTNYAFYVDPDGVTRPGDGYLSLTDATAANQTGDGKPLYHGTASGQTTPSSVLPSNSTTQPTGSAQARRPVILNRPFRSVGELGYAYRDLPFKSLDFFSKYSGDAALLDLFSITDEPSVAAGEVDVSNLPASAMTAIFMGATKMEINNPAQSTNYMSYTESTNAASVAASQLSAQGPLFNRANLVTELCNPIDTALITNNQNYRNKAYAEAPVRALSNVANTRTWNLLIDVIAQAGHMSPTATTLDNFVVEGEKRYWLHIAIDRYTGKIVDQQLEPVYE